MVGGTDGSGTRSIVALLQSLGVRMVIDDTGTNDVHAAVMGGWPPVVLPALKVCVSARSTGRSQCMIITIIGWLGVAYAGL